MREGQENGSQKNKKQTNPVNPNVPGPLAASGSAKAASPEENAVMFSVAHLCSY